MAHLAPESTVSHYSIKQLIARGGMGEVYAAVDLRLGRRVAIKTLPPELAADERARRRFLREARAASILSHPNICTIFEVVQEGPHIFIVMQYIEGKTVQHLISRGPLPVETALGFAIDVAEALEEAHKNGIIHRDIKPSNIIINERGAAVVLDFGLAKQMDLTAAQDGESPTLMQVTTETTVMGTVDYMSPEQVRGKPLDARTDIFSFAILLHEMLTGARPFGGTDKYEVMHAIIHSSPSPISEARPDLTRGLDPVINRALKKDPEDRYQSITEMKDDLVGVIHDKGYVVRGISSASDQRRFATTKLARAPFDRALSARHLLTFAIAVLAVGAILWVALRPRGEDGSALPPFKFIKITDWKSEPGEVLSPGRLSPDGRMVAFSSTRNGSKKIWVKQLTGDEPTQITKDPGADESPLWSPDGGQIAFVSNRGNQTGIWTVAVIGGTPKELKSMGTVPALTHWSKDGTKIYYEANFNLFTLDLASRETAQITRFDPARKGTGEFSVSPLEDRIAFIDRTNGSPYVWVMPMKGGEAVQVTIDSVEGETLTWHPDGRRIIYSSNSEGVSQVFMLDLKDRKSTQITFNDSDISVSDVSPDGTKILYHTLRDEVDLWSVRTDLQKEYQLTSNIGSELWPAVSSDGQSIAYQSTSAASLKGPNLLNCSIMVRPSSPGGQQAQVASKGFEARWSPDGRRLAFLRSSNNQFNIWTVKATGGEERQLTTGGVTFDGYSFLPTNHRQVGDYSWSPDGRQIVYCSNKSGQPNLYLISVNGSGESRLSDNADPNLHLHCPVWSPDGRRIAYVSRALTRPAAWGVWVAESGGSRMAFQSEASLRLVGWSESGEDIILESSGGRGAPSVATDVTLFRLSVASGARQDLALLKSAYFFNLQLSPDGRTIAFASRREGTDNVWLVPSAGGAARRVTANNDPRIYISSLAWSPDGKSVYYGKQESWRLISLIDGFK